MKGTFVTAILLALASSTMAADWDQFRGPFFNGSTDEANLPTDFSPSKNVVWAASLPGASAATPIVSGDHVFVSSASSETDELIAQAFDRETGKSLWTHTVGTGVRRDSRSSYASPTPAADGERVIFFFGSGELIAYSYDGEKVWERNIVEDYGDFAFQWTFSTSLVIYDGKLFLQVLQRDTPVSGRGFSDRKNESYILAMDPSTGETLWKQVRPSKAVAESREGFTTPMPCVIDGKPQLVVIGGDAITGHDLEDGEEIWRWGTWNPTRIGHWRHVPSPIVGANIALICAPKKDPVYAIKLGGEGELSNDDVAWVSSENRQLTSDVPTPAFYDGDFFVLSDVTNSLLRIDPKTGQAKWTAKTPRGPKFEASPLVADGKIYCINFSGDVVIYDAESGKEINSISMDEPSDDPVRSSVIAARGQLFVRTNSKLYCIAN